MLPFYNIFSHGVLWYMSGMQMIGIPRVECTISNNRMHAVEVTKMYYVQRSCTFSKRVYNVWNLAWTWSWGKLVSRHRKSIERHNDNVVGTSKEEYIYIEIGRFTAMRQLLISKYYRSAKGVFSKTLTWNVLKTHANRSVSFWLDVSVLSICLSEENRC